MISWSAATLFSPMIYESSVVQLTLKISASAVVLGSGDDFLVGRDPVFINNL